MGPGPIGGVPSVGVFLRDPSPYLREFRRKPPGFSDLLKRNFKEIKTYFRKFHAK